MKEIKSKKNNNLNKLSSILNQNSMLISNNGHFSFDQPIVNQNKTNNSICLGSKINYFNDCFIFDMLLILPVPMKQESQKFFIEEQAAMGLLQWSKNFGRIAFMGLLQKEDYFNKDNTNWTNIENIPNREMLFFFPLPWSYNYIDFFKNFNSSKKLIEHLIKKSRYLQFSPYNVGIGDWGAIGVEMAIKNKRSYCLHYDWNLVEMININGKMKKSFF